MPTVKALVVCQLRHVSNIDFLQPGPHAMPPKLRAMRSGRGSTIPVEDEMASLDLSAGRVLSPSLMRCVLSRLLETPRLPELLELLLVGGDESNGCLLLRKVPSHLRGGTYRALLEHLAKDCAMLPLGLLRSHPNYASANQHSQRYSVIASPSPDLRLSSQDQVFVIGSAPPSEELKESLW